MAERTTYHLNRERGKTRQQVYEFIVWFMDEHGYAPTMRDICNGLGLASSATAFRHVQNLKAEGLIDYQPYKNRTIIIK